MDPISKAASILDKYTLCPHCLGRLFALMGYGLENHERGTAIMNLLNMLHVYEVRSEGRGLERLLALASTGHKATMEYVRSLGLKVDVRPCHICGGLMDRVERLADGVVDAVAKSGIRFRTFEVGTRIDESVLAREMELVKEFGITTSENIKREANRRLGRLIRRRLGKPVDKNRPDIVIVVDVERGTISVERMPIYIYTRYIKPLRGITQVQRVPGMVGSIREEVDPLRRLFMAEDLRLHAAGREDMDVRMLGNGRPLVIEVSKPMNYEVAIDEVAKALSGSGRVVFRLDELRYSTPSEVTALKAEAKTHVKLYRALALSDRPISGEDLKRLEDARNLVVSQLTPRRIRRRRLRRRRRTVYSMWPYMVDPHVVELFIRAQGGLYVKEFIDGDMGRTTPSVSEILGAQLSVVELDVLAIHD